jgi:hypothetical protein
MRKNPVSGEEMIFKIWKKEILVNRKYQKKLRRK